MQNTAIDLEWIRPYLNSVLYWVFIIGTGYAVFRIASHFSPPSDDGETDNNEIDDEETDNEGMNDEKSTEEEDESKSSE